MAKSERIEVRLPRETELALREIAKLAGLSVESAIKLALATEVWRWKKGATNGD
jgi:hypothetical protein